MKEKPGLSIDQYKKETFDGELTEKAKSIIVSYLEKFSYQLRNKSEETFNQPLDEKYGKLKNILDRIARGTRYASFVIGIIFFFISLFLTLIKQ